MKVSFKKKLVLGAVLVSFFVLLTSGGLAGAAEPKGAFKCAVPTFDAEVFDPILHSGVAAYQYLVYLDLVGVNVNRSEIDPRTGIAYKWEVNDDNTVWTFHLRKDAKWWDGTPITAHDVKFSIPRNWQPGARAGRVELIRGLMGGKNVDQEVDKRIEIIDDYTVRFHLAASNFRFADILSGLGEFGRMVPKHYIEKNGPKALVNGSMGSGPYKIVEHVEGSLIRFEAWPQHPFLQPVYKEVQFRAIPEESTRLAMLKTGELDIAEFSFERLPELEKAGLQIIKKPTGTLLTIFFTEPYKDPVLAKKEVRRAIMMAIDKEAFNKAFFYGAGEYVNDGGNLAQVVDPRNMVTRDPIPYDLEAAKKIIAREVPKDYILKFFAVIRGEIKSQHVEALAAMLRKAGLKIDIELADYKTLRPKWQDGKLGSGIYLKNGRKYLVYYPTIYANSPEKRGRHHLIQIPPKVQVNPDIPKEDLESLRCMDDLTAKLISAKNWDEYWKTFSEIMDRSMEQIAPGSGFLFTPRIFAARPGVLPKWKINMGYIDAVGLADIVIYPPEYEDEKYHPVEWEGEK